jgi:hypothetical protein
MTTKDQLIAARAKIADRRNWTQHVLARDINGSSDHPSKNVFFGLSPRDPAACQWCAVGAIQAVTTTEEDDKAAFALVGIAARQLYGQHPSTVNDDIGHDAVLACFDKAIEDAS